MVSLIGYSECIVTKRLSEHSGRIVYGSVSGFGAVQSMVLPELKLVYALQEIDMELHARAGLPSTEKEEGGRPAACWAAKS